MRCDAMRCDAMMRCDVMRSIFGFVVVSSYARCATAAVVKYPLLSDDGERWFYTKHIHLRYYPTPSQNKRPVFHVPDHELHPFFVRHQHITLQTLEKYASRSVQRPHPRSGSREGGKERARERERERERETVDEEARLYTASRCRIYLFPDSSGVDEVQQEPQLLHIVLDEGASQPEDALGLELARRLADPRTVVGCHHRGRYCHQQRRRRRRQRQKKKKRRK